MVGDTHTALKSVRSAHVDLLDDIKNGEPMQAWQLDEARAIEVELEELAERLSDLLTSFDNTTAGRAAMRRVIFSGARV